MNWGRPQARAARALDSGHAALPRVGTLLAPWWPRPGPTLLEWAYLFGGLLLTLRYAWIFDDAFVYFRYIDNWLFLRLGLVQNDGEYVEGFTSPLWLLGLAALRGLNFPYWTLIRVLGCVAFVVFWLLLVHLQRRLAAGRSVVNLPLAYLALSYGVTTFFTSGMETPLVQVLAVVYALYILSPHARPDGCHPRAHRHARGSPCPQAGADPAGHGHEANHGHGADTRARHVSPGGRGGDRAAVGSAESGCDRDDRAKDVQSP